MKSFLFLLILLVMIHSCTSKKQGDKKERPGTINKDNEVITFKRVSNDSLSILLKRAKKFAEGYEPIYNPKNGIAMLNNIPDSIAYTFKQLRINGNNDYIKYLALISKSV